MRAVTALAAAALIVPPAALAWRAETSDPGTIPVSLGDIAKVTGAPDRKSVV